MHRLELSFEGETHRTCCFSACRGEGVRGIIMTPGFPAGEIERMVTLFTEWEKCRGRRKGIGLRGVKSAFRIC